MRLVFLALLSALLLTGCFWRKSRHGSAQSNDANPALIVNPATAVHGRIVRVNTSTRYVIVSYPFGNTPSVDRRLNVYRGGLKVAEIKINDFRRDTNIVADIVAGECQVGDEVRED